MSHGGAQPGNKHAAKGKAWADSLRKVLVQFERADVPQGQALYKIAERVVEAALAGDAAAIAEIGNRLDGKAAQDVNIEHSGGVALEYRASEELSRALAERLGANTLGAEPAPLPH